MNRLEEKNLALRWLARPLRCGYSAVLVRGLRFPLQCAEANSDGLAYWGLGCQSNGSEIVGLWIAEHGDTESLAAVSQDLRFRGVEDVGVALLGGDRGADPFTRSDPSDGVLGGEALHGFGSRPHQSTPRPLRPAQHRLIRSAESLGEGIHGTLDRAIARHGVFASEAEARHFLAGVLAVAERRWRPAFTGLRQRRGRDVACFAAEPAAAVLGACLSGGMT